MLVFAPQHLLCAGDDTLEPATRQVDADGSEHWAVTGVGVMHAQCRNNDLPREVSRQSQEVPFKPWGWEPGQTVGSVFGQGWNSEGVVAKNRA